MPVSEAKKRANAKYNAKAYDRIGIIVHKGEKEVIKSYADACGKSLNGFILDAVKEKMAQMDAAGEGPTHTEASGD